MADRIQTQIDIAIKGSAEIVKTQKKLGQLGGEIKKINERSRGFVQSFAKINDQLRLSNILFNNAASGTTAYRKSIEAVVKTESAYNAELNKRNLLLKAARSAQGMGLAVDPVLKSIERNRRKTRPTQSTGGGYIEFSQNADKILAQKILTQKQGEKELQQALLALEIKSAKTLNEKLQIQGELNRKTAEAVNNAKLRGQFSPLTSDIRGNIGDIKSRRESNILSSRRNQFGNVFTGRSGRDFGQIGGRIGPVEPVRSAGGFSAFSARADEIAKLTTEEQNLNNIRVKASQDLKVLTRRNDRLLRVQKGRSKQQSLRNAQSNALIGGAFPLLFGQGVGAAAGGAAGGFAGGMMGGQFGFALSLVGTNLGSLVDRLVSSTSEIGKALGPFTADVDAVVNSLGVGGTALGQQLNTYTQVADKTDSLNEATRQMALVIGNDGVKSLRQFGESSTQLKNDFARAMLGMQAAVAKFALFIGNRFKIFDKDGSRALRGRTRETVKAGTDVKMNELTKKINDIISAPFDPEKGVTVDGQTFENKTEAINALQKQREERQKLLDLQNAGLLVEKTVQEISSNQLLGLQEENSFLEDKLKKGNIQAEIEKRMRALTKEVLGDQKELTETQKTQIENQRDSITKAVIFNDELQKSIAFSQQLKDVLSTGVTDAVMGLIEGTKTLSESLAGIARQLASMFLNRAFGSMFDRIFQAEGGYNRAGSFKAFQYGGVVSSPTLGMIGEGGEPEYVIPSSKMSGAMARYSAGARGGAVIPGGSGASGTVAGSSGNTIVEYTGPVLNFNGDEYVPKDSVPQIINAAAKQGATLGQSRTLNTLKNSRSSRAKIGI